MRVRIKSEGFPSKESFLEAFSSSTNYPIYECVLGMLYNSMNAQFHIMGVGLVRYDFQECRVIIQKQYPCDWVLEINLHKS